MKKLIALVALASLFTVGCASRSNNMGGDQDKSNMNTGGARYESNPSSSSQSNPSSSSSSSSLSDTNSSSNSSNPNNSSNPQQ